MWKDTIVARTSAEGQGAVGMVRLSGEKCLNITSKLVRPVKTSPEPRQLYLARIFDFENCVIDEITYIYCKSPASFTGEDTVEIFLHGSPVIINMVIDLCLKLGARMALPGEFTKRAFMNGKIDLTQAESVAELVSAQAEEEVKIAARMLGGAFGKKVKALREELLLMIGWVEASIDFPEEEDATTFNRENLLGRLKNIMGNIKEMIASYTEGQRIRNGLRVTIAGLTNAGKSSLMNSLFDEEKSIVTPIHGTTRDVIEGTLTIGGIRVIFRDTAGIRDTECVIEKEGIKRTKKVLSETDLLIYVIDSTKKSLKDDLLFIDEFKDKTTVFAVNKIDQVNKEEISWANKLPEDTCFISALKHDGVNQIKTKIENFISGFISKKSDVGYTVNQRHYNCLKNGLERLEKGCSEIEKNLSEEFYVVYLHEAKKKLSEIIGEVSADDILDSIFSNFCIGK